MHLQSWSLATMWLRCSRHCAASRVDGVLAPSFWESILPGRQHRYVVNKGPEVQKTSLRSQLREWPAGTHLQFCLISKGPFYFPIMWRTNINAKGSCLLVIPRPSRMESLWFSPTRVQGKLPKIFNYSDDYFRTSGPLFPPFMAGKNR